MKVHPQTARMNSNLYRHHHRLRNKRSNEILLKHNGEELVLDLIHTIVLVLEFNEWHFCGSAMLSNPSDQK